MYLGRLVEVGRQAAAVRAPRHPVHAHAAGRDPRRPDEGRARTPVQGEVPNPLTRRRAAPSTRAARMPTSTLPPQSAGDACKAAQWPPRGGGRPDLSRPSGSAANIRRGTARLGVSRQRTSRLAAVDHHLGGAAGVLVAGHLMPRRRHRQHRHMSPGCTASCAVAAKPVARLAHRARPRPRSVAPPPRRKANDAIQASYIAGRIRSFIAASTMQKFFAAGLQVLHLGQQHAGVADQRAARLEQHLAVAVARASMRASIRAPSSSARWAAARRCRDAQAAAEVEVVDRCRRPPPPRPGRARGPARPGRAAAR